MAKYRRGFKADASWYAAEARRDLGIAAHAPLCPWTLAGYLGYELIKLSALSEDEPAAVAYLMSVQGQRDFSAITICHEAPWVIVHNDGHSRGRQASDLAHELAHGLLLHTPSFLVGADGARIYNREQEDEANWLGPALLISDEAANHIVQHIPDRTVARELYGVSDEVLTMRLGVSGALIRHRHRQAARRTAA